MPKRLAHLALHTFARSTASASALGWVFAHAGQCGVFLPEGSDNPAWPPGTTYLKAGANVMLPPLGAEPAQDSASGWVSQNGSPLSRPLLIHPVLTALAAGQPGLTTAPRQCRP
ncbi:hypothetical protein [[Kitasatospora] papulosa]|uniref:hypothetical protein n=1 Tax=[Kitasatospora] papulosa TaxID=1464011 RepID=UPI003634526E